MSILRGVGSDVAIAVRRLRKSAGFTIVCVATLALGIGGNTAIFTLIDRVLLKTLPVQGPGELYRLGDTDACCVNSGLQGSFSLFSYDLFEHLREAAPQFTQLAAFQANVRPITIGRRDAGATPETLGGAFVSGNYFQLFALSPAAGRLLQPADDRREAPAVAVISHRAWTERFQGRADIIGSSVTLNGVPATIVGVAPAGFYGDTLRPDPAQVWMPLASEPRLQPASRLLDAKASHWLYAIGRLRPDVPTAPLEAALSTTLREWLESTLDLSADDRARIPRQYVTLTSAASGVSSIRAVVAPALALLQGIAAAVLLIACANLANLLVARGLSQRTETAVRVALGAPRRRLVRQVLIESLVLACTGGLAGLAVAFAAARAVLALAFPGGTNVPVDPSPSLTVIGFAFAVSLLTGIIFGVAPAIIGSRADPLDALRGSGRTTGARGSRLGRSLIALQVALSLVLVTGAGLLTRSLRQLESQDFGFQTTNRYVLSPSPTLATVPAGELQALYTRMHDALAHVPGVTNAAYSLYGPMSGDNWAGRITVDGHDPAEALFASWNRVSPGYFDTVGTPLLRGRAFDDRDRPGGARVAMVSESFVRKFFGDTDPIGRRIGFTDSKATGLRDMEIVGIVRDAKYQDPWRAPNPTFYMPFLQPASSNGPATLDRSHYPQAIEVQTAGAVPGLEAALRQALAAVDSRLAVRDVRSMAAQLDGAFSLERLIARLTIAFGATALLLACLGLYGVTMAAVSARTREIGVRMAIGASRAHVLRQVLGTALVQVVAGLAIGLPLALAAGTLLQSRLFGVSGHDPLAIAAGTLALVIATVAAALIPARRAATLDPIRALRTE